MGTLLPPHLEKLVQARVNYERARAFGGPVLRSSSPDALHVGYSVESVDDVDVMVESNELVRSSLVESSPLAFTVRSRKSWIDPDVEWQFHVLDYIANDNDGRLGQPPSQGTRNEIQRCVETAVNSNWKVNVDGYLLEAESFVIAGIRFARFYAGDPSVLVTVAAPMEIYGAGFTSAIG